MWALLQLVALAQSRQLPSPSTPSSQIPPYLKENTSKRRKKKPGAKNGHAGKRREKPIEPTRTEVHTLEKCPVCGDPIAPPSERRTRTIEDIPVTQPEVVEHVIPRCWCKRCQKVVEPVIEDALPKADLGHRALALSAWFHYGLGNTLSQVAGVLDSAFQHTVTAGGLIASWQRMAMILEPWYYEIADIALKSAVLHADETGHRVAGETRWLWCFAASDVTCYHIDDSRGNKALREFFIEAYDGVLVTDFWGAYNKVVCRKRQLCLVHLLRELASVDERNKAPGWIEFRARLKRLLKDAVLLDRLTHRVHILEANGESYRLREAQKRLKRTASQRSKKD